jgi:hypothetical protein
MRRLSRRALLFLASGLLAVGCLSPTLPLPPPSPPDAVSIGQGQYRLVGSIPLAGTVFALNQRTQLVSGEVVVSNYDFIVTAKLCDPMILWYETDTDQSSGVDFTIGSDVPDQCVVPTDSGAPTRGAPSSDAGGVGRDGGDAGTSGGH